MSVLVGAGAHTTSVRKYIRCPLALKLPRSHVCCASFSQLEMGYCTETANTMLTVLLAFSQYGGLFAFNLETRLPVIKVGPEGSYFGYSVAEHLSLGTRTKESFLLVGAPKAKYQGFNHSGAVYKCQLSTYRDDCEQLPIDQDIDYGREQVNKDDQWLGVTVHSQGPGGYILACAHRFVIMGDDYHWGQGICYTLNDDFIVSRRWEPCRNRPVNKAHEQFGYCQAGTSGLIAEDNTIVIGAPGPFTWRGTVFTNNARFKIFDDKRWYFGPLFDDSYPVDKYSYLGMSVTSGIFFGNQRSFVGGAPRSNGTGQVVFYTKNSNNTTFLVQLILDGEQFASSFGYTLTSLDANNDGYLDLVVGAPFYYDKDKGGAIYIYMNSKEGIDEHSQPVKMTGKSESRFSFALENAGDLNQDGYVDLAVGAPYEGGGGTVYIYSGSDSGIMEAPSQVIHAKDIPQISGLRTFGYSLDGGIDIDNNTYPDLLIGSYESNAVILLRSRPVLDIITNVTEQPLKIDPDQKGCDKDRSYPNVCFSFRACFQFNSTLLTPAAVVKLQYRIEAETFTGRKYYRVRFKSPFDSDKPNIVQNEILMKGYDVFTGHCFEELVYLKDKTDIQNPVQFKMTYSLVQKNPNIPISGAPLPDVNAFPILNQQEASKIFEAKFLKDCGENDICESNLVVNVDINLSKDERGQPVLFLGEKQVFLSIKVMNTREPAYDAMLYVTHPASLSYVGRNIVKGDQIECLPYNSTVVSCELGNPLKQTEVELQVRFNPRNVSDDEKILKMIVKANTTSIDDTSRDDITIEAGIVKVAELEIRGATKFDQVFYGGEVGGVPIYEEDIGNEVVHIYEIINHGPWLATGVEMVIRWPFEKADTYEHGKWLLYITENPEVVGNGYCELSPNHLNPLKLKKNPQELRVSSQPEASRTRQKRAVAPQELRMDGKAVKVVTLDCEKNSAKCFEFSCFFKSLERGNTGVVKIKARLWNSTFVEDYPSVDWVSIISRAHIRVIQDDIRQKEHNDFALAETKAFPDILLYQKTEEVPLWIIILAACAGVLLLIILIIILWKCGFFKRKKPGYVPAPTSDKDFM